MNSKRKAQGNSAREKPVVYPAQKGRVVQTTRGFCGRLKWQRAKNPWFVRRKNGRVEQNPADFADGISRKKEWAVEKPAVFCVRKKGQVIQKPAFF